MRTEEALGGGGEQRAFQEGRPMHGLGERGGLVRLEVTNLK